MEKSRRSFGADFDLKSKLSQANVKRFNENLEPKQAIGPKS